MTDMTPEKYQRAVEAARRAVELSRITAVKSITSDIARALLHADSQRRTPGTVEKCADPQCDNIRTYDQDLGCTWPDCPIRKETT